GFHHARVLVLFTLTRQVVRVSPTRHLYLASLFFFFSSFFEVTGSFAVYRPLTRQGLLLSEVTTFCFTVGDDGLLFHRRSDGLLFHRRKPSSVAPLCLFSLADRSTWVARDSTGVQVGNVAAPWVESRLQPEASHNCTSSSSVDVCCSPVIPGGGGLVTGLSSSPPAFFCNAGGLGSALVFSSTARNSAKDGTVPPVCSLG
ncbi:hypothetical protein Taro_021410, partial [Colocasia esculenta]|nr:hypothetical protein [Colocasia esculenta]